MALAPDVDEALGNHPGIQLGPRTGMRFFGPQARVGVLRGARDIPVARDDDAAFFAQLAAEVHDTSLKAALQLVPVTGRASRLVEPRLRRAVDRINVDDR